MAALDHTPFLVQPGKKIRLKDYDAAYTGDVKNKEEALLELEKDKRELATYQDILYAQDKYSLLLVFQAMDAAGKDGTIKHVMSGINPAGCQVFSFKAPSTEELDHTYLWRNMKAVPERGRIGIFNRSHYEETLVVRVHPEYLQRQQLPPKAKGKDVWARRFEEINCFEKHLVDNGTVIIKFFLNVSKEEQRLRFLDRIDDPTKNWKFSLQDVEERQHWDAYMKAYEETFNATSTAWAPWYIIPADKKWFMRHAVCDIIVETLKGLKLKYPVLEENHAAKLQEAKRRLEAEA
jgi:PPK2 family polyphosphate:nucleotide phosphotransferase